MLAPGWYFQGQRLSNGALRFLLSIHMLSLEGLRRREPELRSQRWNLHTSRIFRRSLQLILSNDAHIHKLSCLYASSVPSVAPDWPSGSLASSTVQSIDHD